VAADTTPPVVQWASTIPANAAVVGQTTVVVLSFNELVQAAEDCLGGYHLVASGVKEGTVGCENATIVDNLVILDFTTYDVTTFPNGTSNSVVSGPAAGTYSITIDSYAVQDLDGNDMLRQESDGTYSFEVGTDATAPEMIKSEPEHGGMLGPGTVDITFSEPVTASADAAAELFDCGDDYACDAADDKLVARYSLAPDATSNVSVVTMEGRVAMIDLDTTAFKILDQRVYRLVIAAGAFEDSDSNAVGETTIEFRKDTESGFARTNAIKPSSVSADGYTYAVQFGEDTTPGAYTLCYCDGAADTTLQDLGDQATSYVPSYGMKRDSVVAGYTGWTDTTLNDDICETKCRAGCVGDNCFCDDYSSSLSDMDSTYCLSSAKCRAACDAEASCIAISTMGDTFCVLSTTGAAESPAPGWTAYLKRSGSVCTHPHDFSAAVGHITVTSRADVGTEYVVPPSETLTIEVSGTGLISQDRAIPFSSDRIMVVDCDGQCGYSGPSASVAPANWHDLKPDHWAVDAPAEHPGDGAKFKPTPYSMEPHATGEYEHVEGMYCAGENLNVKAQPDIALEGHLRSPAEHLCYRKCLVDECTGADCFCDGAYSGYDDEDSNSLCADRHTCEALCDALDGCTSIDMHKGINRCFLNGPCDVSEGSDDTHPSDKYDLLVKLTDETELRRLKTEKRGLLPRVDPGTSHPALLRYKGVTFSSGGSFKVCFCDSSPPGGRAV
jgi:hypothetical protein